MTLFFQCGSFDVWRKLRELRSATLGMESRKANISSFVLRGGSEVMFWEPQNASLHHEGGEILLPTVAENECNNCMLYIELQNRLEQNNRKCGKPSTSKTIVFKACLMSIQKSVGVFTNAPTDFLICQKLKRRYIVDVPNLNFCLSVFIPSPSSSSYDIERELNLELPHLYS